MSSTQKQSCLVIGARGFVGSAMAALASERGYIVSAVGRQDYAQAIGARFDLVVFAAGNARRYLVDRDPAADLDANVGAVYRALRDFPACRFVLVSSVDVYPDPATSNREDTEIDMSRLSTYGFHKRLAELVVMRGAPGWLIVRLGQMVGPGLAKGPIHDALSGQPLRVAPSSSYPFLNTASAAAITFELLEGGARESVFNVCGAGSVSLERALALLPAVTAFEEHAPVERYTVDVGATAARCKVPSSWDEVRAFVRPS